MRYWYKKMPKASCQISWMFVAELGMISAKMPTPMYISFLDFLEQIENLWASLELLLLGGVSNLFICNLFLLFLYQTYSRICSYKFHIVGLRFKEFSSTCQKFLGYEKQTNLPCFGSWFEKIMSLDPRNFGYERKNCLGL